MTGKVSVILPVYNEARVLRQNAAKLERALASVSGDFEIIISENGSTDDTVEKAKSLESERVRVLHHAQRLGKGAAIKAAAEYARGQIVIFMDADLASNPDHVRQLISYIEDGADIVVGSRYMDGSKTKRDPVRNTASKGFNWLVRASLGSRLLDHQCGFKSFRKDRVLPVINEIEEQRWFWDTELLVRAQRKGLKIKEIPIEWVEAADSKFRLMQDSFQMLRALVRFKLRNG
jgi:glycosyltransferase involved in cell wall biosynthesis